MKQRKAILEDLPKLYTDTQDPTKLVKEINEAIANPKKLVSRVATSKSIPIGDRLLAIEKEVYRILGTYKDNTIVITSEQEFSDYITKAIENGIIAVDTETNNSLEPITCKLMGLCIYTPGMKNAYIPVNHTTLDGVRLPEQISEKFIKEQLDRLTNTKIIMHNGKFDYEVIKCTCDCELDIYWDTMIAARLLDENESASLKWQYINKIDPSIEKYDIEHLFDKLPYAIVKYEVFALYAATDSFMTYELYKLQKKLMELPDNEQLYKLFREVEMPIIKVAASMELEGVRIDKDFAKILSNSYHKRLEEVEKEIDKELAKLEPKIMAWKQTKEANYHPYTMPDGTTKYLPDTDAIAVAAINSGVKPKKSKCEQLGEKVSTTSPTQLSILFYDILGVEEVYDKKAQKYTRPTGEEALSAMKFPICKLILKERELNKLLGTYIDKLPECVCEKDNKLHAHFNQLGTDTGRFSSTSPNLQNIPSHVQSIRMMFIPGEGNVMVGADFSQQEPRLLSQASQEPAMIDAYRNGKDLYATMGTGVYHNDYWDNMEHYEDGSPNVEGKKRRKAMKILYLGISYGMGASLIASNLGCSKKEAETILENFYKGFPKVKEWKDRVEAKAKKCGYVEDLWGRRRRLPNLFLPKYEVVDRNEHKKKNKNVIDYNPFPYLDITIKQEKSELVKKYEAELNKVNSQESMTALQSKAIKDHIQIHENTGKISTAERQCVNAVIQGSAATMSKKAMILVYNDKLLKSLGFKLLIAVHDELIGECPKENAEAVEKRLTELMIASPGDNMSVPFKCDGVIVNRWYEDEYLDTMRLNYSNSITKDGLTSEEAYAKIIEDNPEAIIFNKEDIIGGE